ncbi:hypothetical protein CJF30_00007805 [Rutstroemia sp. NJR-2017a BBW]|nr:hypothetical protein CJF30_00007805 [Rutstroemia sp. NJR-2017a BBW]
MTSSERLSKRQRGAEILQGHSAIDGGDSDEIDVCFGLVDLPLQRGPHLPSSSIDPAESVFLSEHNELLRLDDSNNYGTLSERSARIIRALRSAGCATQFYCHARYPVALESCETNGELESTMVTCCVVLYGPKSISEDVGSWLADYGLFLQDPLHCDRNVLYHNPHVLHEDNHEPVMTFSFNPHVQSVQMETLRVVPNLFELLNQERNLLETVQPSLIRTLLHKSASKLLPKTMLINAQTPKASSDVHVKTGKYYVLITIHCHDLAKQYRYINNITGKKQQTEPPNFRAGLLADQMGLGKSLSMIALIAANQYSKTEGYQGTELPTIKATLIVVPLSHLGNAAFYALRYIVILFTDLDRHLYPTSLSWCRFHGVSKPAVDQLHTFDVVITTYNTVAIHWKAFKNRSTRSPSLFSVYWHRIILDEGMLPQHASCGLTLLTSIAHIIQNRSAAIAKATCDLEAQHRWAVTGTPIQNRLTDLASLFQFLRIYPYSNPLVFNNEIVRSWQDNDNDGFLRVKTLVNFVTLYRTTATISLPPRHDLVQYLDFSPNESDLYESTKTQTRRIVEDALGNPQKGVYMNALQWLTQLRLICVHGTMHRQKEATTASTRDSWSQFKAQEMFESMLDAGNAICAMCSLNLADATLKDVETNDSEIPRPKLSECLHLVCGSCLTEDKESTRCPVCQPIAHCLGYRVSFAPTEPLVSETKETLPIMKPGEIPTKIVALMESLKSLKADDKCVVFSYWTYTLDLIESSFISNSIQYTRIDGRLSSKKRNLAIQEFQEDPSVRAILVSITCGGTGLDLTAGSVVYLMEPQWNPMMEEQALCRVHRMGQKKVVTTIRYRMKNSFEEQVVTVQERKKDLAALTFANGKISEADVGAARLQYLRAALG